MAPCSIRDLPCRRPLDLKFVHDVMGHLALRALLLLNPIFDREDERMKGLENSRTTSLWNIGGPLTTLCFVCKYTI